MAQRSWLFLRNELNRSCCNETLWPVADLLGTLHGISCIADVVLLESHHGLHFHQRGVDKSMVHTLIHSAEETESQHERYSQHMVCRQGLCFGGKLLYDLYIALCGESNRAHRKCLGKQKAVLILPISFTVAGSPMLSVCFAGPPLCEVLNQSDLGRQLQQTPHILENGGPGPRCSLSW